MNNNPVAWAYIKDGDFWDAIHPDEHAQEEGRYTIPLYTHQVKEQKCVVLNCENHKHEGSFNGDICSPCYQFIAHGKGVYSQAYRNTHPVKELTDEEIEELIWNTTDMKDFARAILKKASEK